VTVTVVGKHCLGTVDKTLARHARSLADAAKVDLLTVNFSADESNADFLGADLWTDISAPEVADGILEYLSGATRTSEMVRQQGEQGMQGMQGEINDFSTKGMDY